MKLCKDPGCKCKKITMCVLCKYYDWDAEVLKADIQAVRMCNLRNDMVKGYYDCEEFECFRVEDDEYE